MDDWAWEQLQPWLTGRLELPVGPLFCVITGLTRGAASRHTNSDTPTPSGSRRRACR
jgi:hypothetical protein